VRWATLALFLLVACNDIRDWGGRWQGKRVGDAPALRVGPGSAATLDIDAIDSHGIRARLAIDGFFETMPIVSLPGAEADALATMTFSGSPLRVFLCFAAVDDGNGDALVVIALYDDDRVEVRMLRGGLLPVYEIFTLQRSP